MLLFLFLGKTSIFQSHTIMAPFPVPSAMFQCRVSPSYPSLPDQSPAHCSCPCGKVGANATVVSRRWPWPERWGKQKVRSEKGKENWGIQHTQKNPCDSDPLSRGPTSVVPPPLLHQPNIWDLSPVPTLPGASPKGCHRLSCPHRPTAGWLWRLCLQPNNNSWDLNRKKKPCLGSGIPRY